MEPLQRKVFSTSAHSEIVIFLSTLTFFKGSPRDLETEVSTWMSVLSFLRWILPLCFVSLSSLYSFAVIV